MGKKRKASGHSAPTEAPVGWDDKGGKLGPIKTYEDVADSEDEFHINRDKVMLDDGPDVKRRRKWQEEDALLEPSDEEVLGYSSESEDEEEEDSPELHREEDVASSGAEDQAEEDVEGWGTSRKDYYNADAIQTEEDARMEEQEARIIQQKRLKKMTDADFGFDEDEWLNTATKDAENEKETITENLADVEITPEMTPQERGQILKTRYPEFDFLADEFVKLQHEFDTLRSEGVIKAGDDARSPIVSIKLRALAAYMASLAGPMDPTELHDHPVMDCIMTCREVWGRVKSLKIPAPIEDLYEDSTPEPIPSPQTLNSSSNIVSKKSKVQRAAEAAAEEAALRRAAKLEAADEELADLSNLIPKIRKMPKKNQPVVFRDDDSDFGEETHLSSRAAAEKAQKKKSLRFYTSQIAQKSNRRADAGRDAGGDVDVPYKERIRDRQARLNAEAENRGKKLDEYGRGADLGGASDEEDAIAKDMRGEEDEYYDMVSQVNKNRKMEKAEKYDAIKKAKAENAIVRVVEGEVDEDGKRAIGYVIEKNKGLAPKRKKDVRNPRVKKRKKFEEKKKKLASMKAVYKGGEERGGYGGEKTGIKTGLVKSVKL